ncbi:hypothetical protein GCM10011503_26660 [Henriciella pelagia]|jgi:hypothetical protein|uniref:IclR-ED domain-containing protein n=2 Tax=Hyphomonadaceae TaxID=69657 RepID=A0ABQ1JTM6_9PROT|nr:hypothetical protein GCM10011503_26660 [Henriciella pelagia]
MACVPISIAVDMVQAMSGGAMMVSIAAPRKADFMVKLRTTIETLRADAPPLRWL